jgi:hypothetical protein
VAQQVNETQKELDTEEKSKAEDKIVPPQLKESIKAAKIKDPDMATMMELANRGINPSTDPQKFLAHFGALAEQNDMLRSWGPLEGIRDIISSDSQALRARQQGLLQVGTFLTQKMMEQDLARRGAPQDAGSAAAALGRETFDKLIPLTDIQKENQVEAPRRGDQASFIGPMEGLQNYHTPLEPWQKDIATNLLHGLSTGTLMRGTGGEIVPTSNMNVQGRQLTPQEIGYVDQAAMTPPTQDIPTAPGNLPASAVNKIVEERGQAARGRVSSFISPEASQWADAASRTAPDQPLPPLPQGVIVPPTLMNKVLEERGQSGRQTDKGLDYEKRVESLAAVESMRKYGKVMGLKQLLEVDPELGAQVRQRADIEEPKSIYSFQQDQQLKRQVAAAGPVKSAQIQAEQDAPVKEPQLWRDPLTGKAASADDSETKLRNQGFVKVRPDQIETINQLQTINSGLEDIKSLAEDLYMPKSNSTLGEVARAAKTRAKLYALRQIGDGRVVLLDSIITRLTAPLVKSQGDTANIAVAERQMFADSLLNGSASRESIQDNISNVQKALGEVRHSMGFVDKKQFVQSLLESGKTKEEVKKILQERMK